MNHIRSVLAIVIAACLLPAGAALGDEPAKNQALRAELDAIAQAQAAALNKEDIDAYVKTMHPKSFALEPTKRATTQLLKAYDLSVKVTPIKVIAADGEFVYARVSVETRKVEGPAFRDNIVDAIWAFKKDGDKWKFWSSGVLGIEYIDP